MKKKKIAIVYNCFPHYRAAVVNALKASNNFDFSFIGSDRAVDHSIKLMKFPDGNSLLISKCVKLWGPFYWQNQLGRHFAKNDFDAYIFLGNAYILNYWIWTIVLRLKGKRIYFWTHGWITKKEHLIKKIFKNTFYRLADGLMLYGERAKLIGQDYNFSPKNLHVIGNCLDFESMSYSFSCLRTLNRNHLKSEFGLPEQRSIIMCSARLISACRFDLLIQASEKLIGEGLDIGIVLIGEGPEKESLRLLAERLNVPLKLVGACYNEDIMARYYHLADMTVSPGKVGLTAIHSLTYATPVITHNNLNKQMPEYEAIIDGETGSLFDENCVSDLAMKIKFWINRKEIDCSLQQRCIGRVRAFYSPASQVTAIEKVLRDEI